MKRVGSEERGSRQWETEVDALWSINKLLATTRGTSHRRERNRVCILSDSQYLTSPMTIRTDDE